nr:MFS transporter [Edwardsiella ictaluri]
MLDWSGILLTNHSSVSSNYAGLSYTVFAFAMTIGRLLGDRLIKSFGRFSVFLVSSIISIAGLGVIVSTTILFIMISGFFLIGIGLANIVPILFSAAGRQTTMPNTLAVAAISSIGYAGILIGPAFIGGIAHLSNLTTAFTAVAVLSLSIPLCSQLIRK